MVYKYRYKTPNGFSNILMNSNGKDLTGLWFEGSRDALKHKIECEEKDLPIFRETSKWLDIYFSGKVPDFIPKYKLENLTSFRKEVIDIMNKIPYGKTITYKDISLAYHANISVNLLSSLVSVKCI